MGTKVQYPREFLLRLQNDPLSQVRPENLSKEFIKGQLGRGLKKETEFDQRRTPTPGSKENWRCGANSNTGSPMVMRHNKEWRCGSNSSSRAASPMLIRQNKEWRCGSNSSSTAASPMLMRQNKEWGAGLNSNTGSPKVIRENKSNTASPRVVRESKEKRMGANSNNKLIPEGRLGEDEVKVGVKKGRAKKSPAMLARDAKRREAHLASKKLQEIVNTDQVKQMIDDEQTKNEDKEVTDHGDMKIMVTDYDLSENCTNTEEDMDKEKKTNLETVNEDEDEVRIPEEQEISQHNEPVKKENYNNFDISWDEEEPMVKHTKKRRFYSESCGRRERRMSEGEKVGLWLYQRMAYFPLQAWRKVSRTVGELTSRARIQDIYIPKEWL